MDEMNYFQFTIKIDKTEDQNYVFKVFDTDILKHTIIPSDNEII